MSTFPLLLPTRQRCLAHAAAACVLASAFASQSEARPLYKKIFEQEYPKVVKVSGKVTCNLCHPGKAKKKRNHYGVAFAKELGKADGDKQPGPTGKTQKEVKDKDKIKKALKAIESGSCAAGKWKDRLAAGKYPCLGSRDPKKGRRESFIERLVNRPAVE